MSPFFATLIQSDCLIVSYLPDLVQFGPKYHPIVIVIFVMCFSFQRESEGLHEFLINIIRISTDVREDCHVYLLEDGLLLWLTTLENTATPHDALLQLFDNMLPLMEISSENLRLCLQITTAYTLLCPQQFLSK